MIWTYNTPTENGVYYYKRSHDGNPCLLYVDLDFLCGTVVAMGCTDHEMIPTRIVDQWLGPITPELIVQNNKKIEMNIKLLNYYLVAETFRILPL